MSDTKIKVGIINVTGYAGLELVRILLNHPYVQICSVTGRSQAGLRLNEIYPQIDCDIVIDTQLSKQEEVVFSALPNGAGVEILSGLVDAGVKVIDISGDFRLNDAVLYEQWYGYKHSAPQYLSKAVYGLPELNRGKIKDANFIANPGCYPTCVLLALAPALQNQLITGDIVVDCKSGMSGAGRTLVLSSHFCEANENVTPYKVAAHRHQPEMAQEAAKLLGEAVYLTFVPHVIPMTRGICASCYVPLKKDVLTADALQIYRDFYKDEPFVRVLDMPPSTKYSYGSNKAFVNVAIDAANHRLMAFGAIDNLVKGAAGQAIQNMNLMCGLPETLGLENVPLFP
ncbi:MAG: N-acetyl-gamma-glutamyl-phosphate reductase [Chloroflexi bacterium]|nr:N-acetyl-gamma-glutamyl-phosphate reductase [Chloroflexota bacterium]